MIFAHQVVQGLKHGNPTFVASLLEVQDDLVYEIPSVVADVLKEFQDVMPSELPHKLPSRRAIYHQIELMSGCKLFAQDPYQMAPME